MTLMLFQCHSSVKQYKLENVCSYPVKLKLCRIVKYIKQVVSAPLCLTFCTYSREIIDVFPYLTQKKFHWLFHGSCSSKGFQTLHYYNLPWGLPIHTRFGDLNLVSRLQVCLNHKLQIGVEILGHVSLNIRWLLHTLKRSGTVCFVWLLGRDITNMTKDF